MTNRPQNIPAQRFPGFDGDWKSTNLEEISTWSSGGTPSKVVQKYWDGDIPWISASSMKNNLIFNSELKITREGLVAGSKLSPKGNLLILVRGSMLYNKIPLGICVTDVAFNQDVKSIKIENQNALFVLLWLQANENELLNKVSGTSIGAGKLDLQDLKSLIIHLPSISEQTKIASFLSAADDRIHKLTRKKELLEQYKQGVMQKIFSREIRFRDEEGKDYPEWEEKRLGDIADIYDGTHMTPDYVENGIPFYSVEQVTANDFSKTKFISETVYNNEIKRVKLEKGDILMTRIGDIGTSAYIFWDVKASFYVSLALIKQSIKYNSKYLDQFIKTDFFQRELHDRTIHVAFPKKINLGEISECLVLLPSLEEQQKIASFLSSIDQKISLVNTQIEKMQTWKKGLLQKMFV